MQEKLEIDNFHKTVSAEENFYQHVNWKWREENPIPEDDYRWSAFNEIQKANELKLKDILENLKAQDNLEVGSNQQKLRDFYGSFMNEELVNELGVSPLQNWFDKINNLTDARDLPELLAEFHKTGVNAFWSQFIASDDKQSDINIYRLWQAGLGLPDRDYYFKDDDRSNDITSQYKNHISKMVALSGVSGDTEEFSENVYNFEKVLAEKSLNSEQLRDYESLYHKLTIADLINQAPSFDWSKYLTAIGVGTISELIVSKPEFIVHATESMMVTDIKIIRQYLYWRLLSSFSGVLSHPLAEESFNFYGRILTGTKSIKPRWRRAVQIVDTNLGEALGEEFVKLHFNESARTRMSELVDNLVEAFGKRIQNLDWMSEETKQKALIKLGKMTRQIGYPDRWKDYSSLEIKPDDLFGNYLRAQQFEFNRDLAKIGQPVDKMEWHMSPPTVNAYCSFWFNQIVFPAGILQPVFFDAEADDAVNYGGIGVVIGHEITHGFDDQGRKYDENGSMNSWWTEHDQEQFKNKAQKVSDLYSTFDVVGGYKVNGELTLGENIADIGGLAIAYDALQIALAKSGRPDYIDGLTPEQRFFASYARVWRNNITPEGLEKQIKTDPHSPAEWRVNGALINISEFHEAYTISANSKLFLPPEQRAQVW